MAKLSALMSDYGQDHQNHWNQKIHFICVPLIVWSLLGLLYLIPVLETQGWPVNGAFVFIVISLCYYFYLDTKSFLIMLMVSLLNVISYKMLEPFDDVFYLYAIVFFLAWVGQFVGHKIEGKKPSFLKDLHFLFVGPLWVFYKFKIISPP